LDLPDKRLYFVRDELCVEKPRRSGSGEGREGRSATREEAPDSLRVYGKHKSVRINWVDEADLPVIMSPRISLNLDGWKSLLNKGGRNAARLFTASGRAN
jgi:hypothetical protein